MRAGEEEGISEGYKRLKFKLSIWFLLKYDLGR